MEQETIKLKIVNSNISKHKKYSKICLETGLIILDLVYCNLIIRNSRLVRLILFLFYLPACTACNFSVSGVVMYHESILVSP